MSRLNKALAVLPCLDLLYPHPISPMQASASNPTPSPAIMEAMPVAETMPTVYLTSYQDVSVECGFAAKGRP